MKKILKNNDGFTLIELLVVMSIMSILTVITVGQFMTARAKARDVARKGDLNSVAKALLTYYNDYGIFPYSFKGRISLDGEEAGMINWGGEFKDTATPPYVYMKVLPTENTGGYPQYCYAVSLDRKKFALYTMLESKADSECHNTNGTGDYNACESRYCYAVASPNAAVAPDGTLN